MVDWTPIVKGILFALFSLFTAALYALLQPTYDNLFVPELAPAQLFPSLAHPGSGGVLATAAQFSEYMVGHLVDPGISLVLLLLGLVYLSRAFSARLNPRLVPILPRLVVGIIGANFTLPIAGAILDLSGATFGVVAGFDGGAWQRWSNLFPWLGLSFSWDNGALAFVVTFVLFSTVLLLAVLVAVRDALLGVLLVLLPVFMLLWPIPSLASLARRAWLLLGELAFLPAVMVIPLELAVGAPSVLLVLACVTVSLGSPYLISVARAQIGGLGLPGAGGALTGGVQRGLTAASLGADSTVRGFVPIGSVRGGRAVSVGASAASWVGKGAMPLGPALAVGHLAAQGTSHLLRHLRTRIGRPSSVPGHPARTGVSATSSGSTSHRWGRR